MLTVVLALAATCVIAATCIVAGVVAMLPDGVVAHGVTIRDRIDLYFSSASCLLLMGGIWLRAGGLA